MTGVATRPDRLLDREPVADLRQYLDGGGGEALAAARHVEPEALIAEVDAAGLRGRGGAGFPTGRKWRTVREQVEAGVAVPLVVNAAEGEPGTFKDRALLRIDPYRVLEGALVAALAVGAERVRIGIKASFESERARIETAITEAAAAGWLDGIETDIVVGPGSYLFGEETGLLEVLDGRPPFPRIAPPYRRGVDDDGWRDVPAVVDNVETLANVTDIIAGGAEAYRRVGTAATPGTLLCTVSGDARTHGVLEVPAGTPLRQVLDEFGGVGTGREVGFVLCGASGPAIPPDLLDVPLDHDAMAQVGVSLGSCSFIVFDDRRDPLAAAEAVARFLAVESCGQCDPCKRDGLAIAETLWAWVGGDAGDDAPVVVRDRLRTVADGARCNLARQQEAAVGSLLDLAARRAQEPFPPGGEHLLIAPVVDLVDGRFVLDEAQATKQPDWSHGAIDSGEWPARRAPSLAEMLRPV